MAGTAILLTVGLSAVCFDFGPGSPMVRILPATSLRLLVTGLVFAGSGSLVAISPLGRRSGAHLNHWVYVVGPVTGAALAVGASRLVPGHHGPLTAKMFHDPSYPSVFDTAM
ncbi:MAG: hypothetical protein ACR2MY_00715 [Candidatus Dormibacteria bacterium]